MIKSLISKISFALLSFFLISTAPVAALIESQSQDYEVFLPNSINSALPEGKRIGLHVKVPREFHAMRDPATAPSILFVLPGSGRNWFEAIFVQAMVGVSINADWFLRETKKVYIYQRDFHDVTVVSESIENCTEYTKAMSVISYASRERRILSVNLFYGSMHDHSILSYEIALSDELSQDQALEKIETFVQNKITIVNY